jgi:flagellar hook-length control protein FliK
LRGANQDFAGALRDAGGKPARKSTGNKPHEAALSGSALPVPGNQAPPVPASPPGLTPSGSPPAVNTDLLAAAQAADAAGAIPGLPAGAAGADPSANPTAPPPTANAGSTAVLAPHFDVAPATPSTPGGPASTATGSNVAPTAAGISVAPSAAGSAVATAAGIGSAGSGDAGGPAANSPAVSGSGLNNPPAPSIRTLASTATSADTRIPPALQGAKSNDGASQGAIVPASSQTSAAANAVNDPTLNESAAAAPAQAVMAAAVVQGAPSANFAPSSNDLSPDDLAAADTVLQGVAAPKDEPAGAPAAASAQAAAALSAAVTAATAGRIAQEVSSTAEAGAADKRSHANSPELSLSGASNDGGVGAAQLLTSNTAIDSSPAPTFKVAAGVDTAGFGQGVADKVSVMVDSNLTSAKLQVNPPALGPIEVRIALQGGHAQVWLSSHSAVTRDALESSSPKLREMLGSQGFSQVSVDISQRSFQERSPPSQAYEAAPSIRGDAAVLAPASASISRSAIGLLDAYA